MDEPDETLELREEGEGYAAVRLQRNRRYRLVVPRTPVTLRIVLGLCDNASSRFQDRPEVYKLWSDDGAYEKELAVRDSAQFSGNHVVLEFLDLRPNRTYSLACDFHGDGIYDQTLFEKVAYARLRQQCMEGARADELKFEPPEDNGEPVPEDALDASIQERDRTNEGGEAR